MLIFLGGPRAAIQPLPLTGGQALCTPTRKILAADVGSTLGALAAGASTIALRSLGCSTVGAYQGTYFPTKVG